MSTDLDDILDDVEATPVPTEPVEPPPEPATPTGETEPEVKAETQPGAAEPNEPETPPVEGQESQATATVPRAALEDERRKRQELEKDVNEFKQWKAGLEQQQRQLLAQQQQPQQPVQPPDIFEDPEGYQKHLAQQNSDFATNLQSTVQGQIYETRVELTQDAMREKHADYEEVEEVFAAHVKAQMEKGDLRLLQQLYFHPNPAKFSYEQGRKIKLMSDIGDDPDAYINAQVEARLAERNGQTQVQPNSQPPAAPPPKSLVGTASAQPRNSKGQWAGPASLDDILSD